MKHEEIENEFFNSFHVDHGEINCHSSPEEIFNWFRPYLKDDFNIKTTFEPSEPVIDLSELNGQFAIEEVEGLSDEVRQEIYSIISNTDSCLSSTVQEMDDCDRFCTGNGCPLWESTTDKIMSAIDQLSQPKEEDKDVFKESVIRFATWYSGMDSNKVERAYQRYLKEIEPPKT